MAKSIHYNYTDSGVQGVTSLSHDVTVLNFGKDFRVKSDEPNEAVITNITSPIDRPETFRFAVSTVADVYRGTGIEPAYRSPSTKGLSLVVQLADILNYYDESIDDAKECYIPMQGHIVLKVPANEAITEQVVDKFVSRLIAGLYSTGTVNPARIKSMLRGSLIPTDM